MVKRAFVFLAAASLACACGGGSSSSSTPTTPTAVTPPAPTVTGLSISSTTDAIRTGFFTNLTAQSSLSNGTSQTVTPTWSSSSAAIATVAANGDVMGIANGIVSITATYQGVSSSKSLRVTSNFGGAWSGSYRISKCDQSQAFAGWCAGLGGVGTVLPLSLNLTQGGAQRDVVTGTLSLGTIIGNTAGNVTGDGRLILGGTFTNNQSGTVFAITIGGWDTRLSDATGMTGGWSQSITANGFSGNAYQENTLISITHTSVGSSVQHEGEREPVIMRADGAYSLPWPEFFRLMRSSQ